MGLPDVNQEHSGKKVTSLKSSGGNALASGLSARVNEAGILVSW